MATDKLLKAVISGPEPGLDEAVRTMVLDRQFHLLRASESLHALGKLTAPEERDPFRPVLDSALALMSKLGITPAFREFRGLDYDLESAETYINDTAGECARLATRRSSMEELARSDLELCERLRPFAELGVDLSELTALKTLEARFGWVHEDELPALDKAAAAESDVFLFRTGEEREERRVYCVYLTLPESADRAAERFDALGWNLEEPPAGPGMEGVPGERIALLKSQAASARDQAAAISSQLTKLREAREEELLSRYSWLTFMSRAAGLRTSAGLKDGMFYLAGWLPETERESFTAQAQALGLSCDLESPGHSSHDRVPVKFRDGFFSRIFAPFVDMYGYPDYGEADPRLFMTITYCLLFGIMFGDIGQGAVLVLLGLFLTKKKGMWLGRIIAAVGVSAIVFGFVYGSVFGNEHLLPGFKVLEEGNLTNILLVSAGVGVLLIIACGVLNIASGLKQHDYKKALFSANGAAGVIFFAALVGGAVCTLLLGVNLLGNLAYTLPLIALPLLCIWFGEPLAWLLEGRHGQLPSLGMIFLEGFFDLFESCLSWFSNCLSFLRVGTYTICHAIMMMVVYTLSAQPDGGYAIYGLVIGNIIVMVIEAVLVCIQVLRLEFYELFGRFYSGRGAPFRPTVTDYSGHGVHAA